MLDHTIAYNEAGSQGENRNNINSISDISDRWNPDTASIMLGHTKFSATSRVHQAGARRTTPAVSVTYAKQTEDANALGPCSAIANSVNSG